MGTEVTIKGSTGNPISAEVNQGLVLDRSTKRVTNLSKNEKIYEQGDGMMKIAPFDNYYLFTIYSEIDLEDTPVDLHNMGSFFLTFKDKTSEVRIQNYTNTKDVDPAAGQILFRISQEEAEKILSMETEIFYVTSMIVDNNSNSDETVIYSGKFAEYNKGNVQFLTDKIESLNNEINDLKTKQLEESANYQKTINDLTDALSLLQTEYSSIEEDLKSYKNAYEELCKKMDEQSKIEEKSNKFTIERINELLKKNSVLVEYKVTDSKLAKDAAVASLKQNIIGIKPEITETSIAENIKKELYTEKELKLSLANINIKSGIVYIYAFVYTKYADINTESQKTVYNQLVNTYKSIEAYITDNKYNNIEYSIIYNETDYGKFIEKYNIDQNSVVIVKDNEVLGKINITSNRSSVQYMQMIKDIIDKNN